MSEVVHLARLSSARTYERTCDDGSIVADAVLLVDVTCLGCLLACAEYGSEARHRYEVLRESGVKP